MKKDLNEIAKIEKAISKKFGKESIINPKSGWDDDKEKQYLENLKQFYSKVNLIFNVRSIYYCLFANFLFS